jgi:hypothetical protein
MRALFRDRTAKGPLRGKRGILENLARLLGSLNRIGEFFIIGLGSPALTSRLQGAILRKSE